MLFQFIIYFMYTTQQRANVRSDEGYSPNPQNANSRGRCCFSLSSKSLLECILVSKDQFHSLKIISNLPVSENQETKLPNAGANDYS